MERTPDEETPTEAPPPEADRVRPGIDLSSALHEAGHEVHDLGWDDVPDTGPVVEHQERSGPEDPLDFVIVQMPTD